MSDDSEKKCSQCIGVTANGKQCKKRTCKSQKCWIHLQKEDGLRIKKSTIPGVAEGLFATTKKLPSDIIGIYDGIVYNKFKGGDYVVQVNKNKFVDGKDTNSSAVRYSNDCRPGNRKKKQCSGNNAFLSKLYKTTTPIIKANELIKPGQEIFTAYGSSYWRDHARQLKEKSNNQNIKEKVPMLRKRGKRISEQDIEKLGIRDIAQNQKTKKAKVAHPIIKEQSNDDDDVEDSLKTLEPRQWVDSTIIDEYFKILYKEYQSQSKSRLKLHFYNTAFYYYLYDHKKKIDTQIVKEFGNPFQYDKVLIPINIGNNHWLLAYINMRIKELFIYDSIDNEQRQINIINNLLTWLMSFIPKQDRKNEEEKWKAEIVDAPLQTNGFDCGVFTMKYADHIVQGKEEMRFTTEDMPRFRQEIKNKIIQEINK